MLTDKTVRHRYNETFVSSELLKFQPFFDDLDERSLSDQQREACIRLVFGKTDCPCNQSVLKL